MSKPTALEQWYTLIQEAQSTSTISLQESLESYLVFLLMRFSNKPELSQSVLGMEFLEAHHSPQYDQLLRDVGDKCLLFSGLFPEQAKRRRVKVSYFIELGQTAYRQLAHHGPTADALFDSLAQNFVPLRDVLQATRAHTAQDLSENLLSAMDLWQSHDSQYAFKTLERSGKVLPFPGPTRCH